MQRCPIDIPSLDWTEVQANPHGTFARHRAAHWYAPIAGSRLLEVLTYADARALMADDERMREYLLGHLGDVMAANPSLNPDLVAYLAAKSGSALINLDGEPHQRLRGAVSRAFTPRVVAAIRPALESLSASLAESLTPGDDFVERFARVLPARSLCLLTGIPDSDHERFASWIDVLQDSLSPAALNGMTRERSDELFAVQQEMDVYTRALVEERRRDPQDDLVSRLARDPEQLETGTIAGLIGDLIFAGNDTTRKALAAMVLLLADEPEHWEAVAADRTLAESIVEEVLRLSGPAPGPIRRAAVAFEYRGEEIPAGTVAALSIWAGNRDPAVWGESAGEFEPARAHAGQHLSFGHGAHFCLGASLAREELRATLLALASRMTGLRILSNPEMPSVGSIYGPLSLHLDFQVRQVPRAV